MRPKALAIILLAFGFGFSASQATEVQIRDARTGFSVEGEVIVKNADDTLTLQSFETDAWGKITLEIPLPDSFRLVVRAPGYRSLETRFHLPQSSSPVIVNLEPLWLPSELRAERLRSSNQVGFSRVHGHISDLVRGLPLEGVEIRATSGEVDYTNERGYFSLELAVPWHPDQRPALQRISMIADGFKTSVREIALVEGVTHLIISLREGQGVIEWNLEHSLYGSTPWESPNRVVPFAPPSEPQFHSRGTSPPTSIKVGFNSAGCDVSCCSGGSSCSHVCVFSLEEYVRRGLNDEWIASWGQHSLRSGSVAYRSYGAWYTDNPINGTWDICSSACCQVNDPNTTSATDAAVTTTVGILLERQGAFFRAEYSAENNSWDDPGDGLNCSNTDLSCGDGVVGSPNLDWPCLTDTVAAGHGCFGHGRGMSQWGTFRWEGQQDRLWPWIVNHYYNDNGNPAGLRSSNMISPLAIDTVSWSPDPFSPGDTFTIEVEATNSAAEDHGEILIGASIYSPTTGYLSDPSNDAPVDVVVGSSTVERFFQLANDTPLGTYDLVVALWLDADENGLITSEDLSLVSMSTSGEPITVEPSSVIFEDGFESGDTSAWNSVSFR